ncbi:MAG TPA: DeoR family transcriptional regulator [Dongiaceae bacterium]|jgi:DeoR family glycerol-3-phosphate regulon repressor|nr:DeoR family transcriptional regulator [Dongiaceae bacterium]
MVQQRQHRHEEILELVRRRGYVPIEALAAHFAVTAQTIRRDLNQLSDQDLLRRYHGGAGLASSVENVSYSTRQVHMLEEKRRIARTCAQHIPNDSSLFINIGTTSEEVARALLRHRGLRVITNNLNVAAILSENQSCELIVAGGQVRHADRAIIGEAALDFISQFRVDFAIVGVSGIDLDGTLLDYDYSEIRAAQLIMRNSRQHFLISDHSKYERKPLVRLGNIADVDAFFTDVAPPDPIREILEENDIRLHIAPVDYVLF